VFFIYLPNKCLLNTCYMKNTDLLMSK
jgi:hypothetical protein